MRYTCAKENLIEGINIVQKAVSTKTSLPILEGILVEAGDRLKLTGNDLEIGIECYVDANIYEKGSVVINSRIFGDIVRRLPDTDVAIEVSEKNLVVIECGSSHFEIKGLPSDGFPVIPDVKKENSFSISQNLLRDMIRQTNFAVSIDEYRPILTGSLMEYSGDALSFVAIDGNRVALRKSQIKNDSNDFKVVIPGKTLNDIVKILQTDDEEITVYCSQNQIVFDNKNFKVVSRLLEGEFMNYRNVIPNEFETKVTVITKDLLSSIERAYLVITGDKDRRSHIKFDISNDKLIINSNTETGSVREEVKVEMSGKKLVIGFNPVYFIDALRAIEDEAIDICLTTNIGPCTLKPISGDSFSYLILPVRI